MVTLTEFPQVSVKYRDDVKEKGKKKRERKLEPGARVFSVSPDPGSGDEPNNKKPPFLLMRHSSKHLLLSPPSSLNQTSQPTATTPSRMASPRNRSVSPQDAHPHPKSHRGWILDSKSGLYWNSSASLSLFLVSPPPPATPTFCG
jgi:hypothetical protein